MNEEDDDEEEEDKEEEDEEEEEGDTCSIGDNEDQAVSLTISQRPFIVPSEPP